MHVVTRRLDRDQLLGHARGTGVRKTLGSAVKYCQMSSQLRAFPKQQPRTEPWSGLQFMIVQAVAESAQRGHVGAVDVTGFVAAVEQQLLLHRDAAD